MKPFPTHPPVAPNKDFKLSWNDGVISLPRLRTSVDLRSPPLPEPVESINKDGVSKTKSEKTIDENF